MVKNKEEKLLNEIMMWSSDNKENEEELNSLYDYLEHHDRGDDVKDISDDELDSLLTAMMFMKGEQYNKVLNELCIEFELFQ